MSTNDVVTHSTSTTGNRLVVANTVVTKRDVIHAPLRGGTCPEGSGGHIRHALVTFNLSLHYIVL